MNGIGYLPVYCAASTDLWLRLLTAGEAVGGLDVSCKLTSSQGL